ncbi:uncharacterized protein LOC108049694 [Drosophila rhopaloa]|uniref:Uncharacterized protein LOC108049694 n=1 Tax=Drosophila rhopaloa TaxID=1041015 RepID=A0A6P4FMI6_DRORH|nr:uncharacterized protein LOC108049694 [Drosophila rhopaloa]
MFLGFLVDLFDCRRLGGDGMMEFPSTPAINETPPKPVKVKVVLPLPPPLTFEIVRNPWAPEQECDDGYGFDDPRLPEFII